MLVLILHKMAKGQPIQISFTVHKYIVNYLFLVTFSRLSSILHVVCNMDLVNVCEHK